MKYDCSTFGQGNANDLLGSHLCLDTVKRTKHGVGLVLVHKAQICFAKELEHCFGLPICDTPISAHRNMLCAAGTTRPQKRKLALGRAKRRNMHIFVRRYIEIVWQVCWRKTRFCTPRCTHQRSFAAAMMPYFQSRHVCQIDQRPYPGEPGGHWAQHLQHIDRPRAAQCHIRAMLSRRKRCIQARPADGMLGLFAKVQHIERGGANDQ